VAKSGQVKKVGSIIPAQDNGPNPIAHDVFTLSSEIRLSGLPCSGIGVVAFDYLPQIDQCGSFPNEAWRRTPYPIDSFTVTSTILPHESFTGTYTAMGVHLSRPNGALRKHATSKS
jgi:hypothetical protein